MTVATDFMHGGRPERVLVFRALQLGDMLVSVPALRALRSWAPRAHITLAGLPWACEFVERFRTLIDDFIAFPGMSGFPEQSPREDELPAFFDRVRAARFDLALQMHGSGVLSNRVVAQSGAARLCGFSLETPLPEGFVQWPETGSEILRCLRLVAELGAPPRGLALEFPIDATEHQHARVLLADVKPPFAVIHAGARLESRRWVPSGFVECGRWLKQHGFALVLTGSPDEAAFVGAIGRELGASVLCGRTDLGSLASVLSRASIVLTNDTGISHIAAAIKTPSVVIVLGSDPARWAPLDTLRHRLAMIEVPCRPCMYARCPIGHPCATELRAEAVCQRLDEVLGAAAKFTRGLA